MRARSRTLAAAVVALVVTAACGGDGDDISAQGERSRLGRADDRASKNGARSSKAEAKRAAQKVGEKAAGDGGRSGVLKGAAPGGFGDDVPTSGIDPSLARASARVQEPGVDAKRNGVVAPYAELQETAVQGLGENVRITLSFSGDIPERMPNDKTFMVIGFSATGRKEGQGYALGANGTDKGWKTYSGAKSETSKYPGEFSIEGNRIVMEVPWSFFDGPRAFEWYSIGSWFSQIGNTSHYSYDPLPNEEAGRFPN